LKSTPLKAGSAAASILRKYACLLPVSTAATVKAMMRIRPRLPGPTSFLETLYHLMLRPDLSEWNGWAGCTPVHGWNS
jgi:queuine/archaeosine tRNA-ribosyltransferase